MCKGGLIFAHNAFEMDNETDDIDIETFIEVYGGHETKTGEERKELIEKLMKHYGDQRVFISEYVRVNDARDILQPEDKEMFDTEVARIFETLPEYMQDTLNEFNDRIEALRQNHTYDFDTRNDILLWIHFYKNAKENEDELMMESYSEILIDTFTVKTMNDFIHDYEYVYVVRGVFIDEDLRKFNEAIAPIEKKMFESATQADWPWREDVLQLLSNDVTIRARNDTVHEIPEVEHAYVYAMFHFLETVPDPITTLGIRSYVTKYVNDSYFQNLIDDFGGKKMEDFIRDYGYVPVIRQVLSDEHLKQFNEAIAPTEIHMFELATHADWPLRDNVLQLLLNDFDAEEHKKMVGKIPFAVEYAIWYALMHFLTIEPDKMGTTGMRDYLESVLNKDESTTTETEDEQQLSEEETQQSLFVMTNFLYDSVSGHIQRWTQITG